MEDDRDSQVLLEPVSQPGATPQDLEQIVAQHRRGQDQRQDEDARDQRLTLEFARARIKDAGKPTATISMVASVATYNESQKGSSSLMWIRLGVGIDHSWECLGYARFPLQLIGS